MPSGLTRTNCSRLERTWPSPDLTSCVSRNSSHGSSPVVGRIHEDRALAEQVGVLFQQDVADGEHERMTGMHQHGDGPGPACRAAERLPWRSRRARSA